MIEKMTAADLDWLEREKFTSRPGETPFVNRAAHNARIDRILAACRRALAPEGVDGT